MELKKSLRRTLRVRRRLGRRCGKKVLAVYGSCDRKCATEERKLKAGVLKAK
jgi:hypothetical protein